MTTVTHWAPRKLLVPGLFTLIAIVAAVVGAVVLLQDSESGGSGGGSDNPPAELTSVLDGLPRFAGSTNYETAYTGGKLLDAVAYANADPKDVVGFFQTEMVKAGWSDVAKPTIVATDPGLGPSWQYVASRDKFTVTVISINSEKDKSLGSAMLSMHIVEN